MKKNKNYVDLKDQPVPEVTGYGGYTTAQPRQNQHLGWGFP